MVFIGGWRSRRNRPYGPPAGYGRRGYRGGGCGRDLCLLESGCCLAEGLGCGGNLGLVAPSLIRKAARVAVLGADCRGSRLVRFFLSLIRLYQVEISPGRGAVCRYTPSCSSYAVEALETHGLRRGVWLSARRLVRCRPGAAGGVDLVPCRKAD